MPQGEPAEVTEHLLHHIDHVNLITLYGGGNSAPSSAFLAAPPASS